ncbi:MAG: rod shape-determining protein MreC [Clostridia bacterium]
MDYNYNFGEKKKNKKKRILFIIIVIVSLVIFTALFFRNSSIGIINSVASVILKPVDIVYDFGFNLAKGASSYFGDSKKIAQENDLIKDENEKLNYQILESQKILDENKSLKEMLNIKKNYQHFDIKLAKIEYREHDNWTQTFKINIGSSDGVKLKQAVVHQNGLVGYISQVSQESSTVTTILDPSSSVSVNISTINEPAILQGDLSLKSKNNLKLSFIPLDAQVSISDMLYTSGLGSTYPSSIPVGKIIEVVNNKNDMNRYAIVEPNTNIRTITEVGVIVN